MELKYGTIFVLERNDSSRSILGCKISPEKTTEN
jgi:hypothetical protein